MCLWWPGWVCGSFNLLSQCAYTYDYQKALGINAPLLWLPDGRTMGVKGFGGNKDVEEITVRLSQRLSVNRQIDLKMCWLLHVLNVSVKGHFVLCFTPQSKMESGGEPEFIGLQLSGMPLLFCFEFFFHLNDGNEWSAHGGGIKSRSGFEQVPGSCSLSSPPSRRLLDPQLNPISATSQVPPATLSFFRSPNESPSQGLHPFFQGTFLCSFRRPAIWYHVQVQQFIPSDLAYSLMC